MSNPQKQKLLYNPIKEEVKIEKLARKICREKCKDFGNEAAVDYLVDGQWREWIPEAKQDLLKGRKD